jgi:hypothetical protein
MMVSEESLWVQNRPTPLTTIDDGQITRCGSHIANVLEFAGTPTPTSNDGEKITALIEEPHRSGSANDNVPSTVLVISGPGVFRLDQVGSRCPESQDGLWGEPAPTAGDEVVEVDGFLCESCLVTQYSTEHQDDHPKPKNAAVDSAGKAGRRPHEIHTVGAC